MDAKKRFLDIAKIPIIGDLIIAFAIIVVLSSLSSAGGYFGLDEQNKKLLINSFVYSGIFYFILAISIRGYLFLKRK